MKAIVDGSFDEAISLISNIPDINALHIALHIAVYHNNLEIVRFLLTQGAKANVPMKDGKNAMDVAVEHNFKDIVGVFLENNYQADYLGETPLMRAINYHNISMVEFCLKKKCDPNACDNDGNTPLHHLVDIAARMGITSMFDYGVCYHLLKTHGAKSNSASIKNKYGQTPYKHAQSQRVVSLIKLFLIKEKIDF